MIEPEGTMYDEPKATVSSVAIKYGLLTGLLSVVFSLILLLIQQQTDSPWGWISYLILISGIVLAYREFKWQNRGYMTYGQGLGIGTLIGVVAGVLSAVFIYIYVAFIDSTILERTRENQIIEMERRKMSDEQIDQAMELTAGLFGPGFMAVAAFIGSIILAFLFSLVIAALMRNSRPDFE
jgi:hypothetical protein